MNVVTNCSGNKMNSRIQREQQQNKWKELTSGNVDNQRQQRKSQNQRQRPATCCTVCGRYASYKHFNAFACQGCGFFFRRFILKGRQDICQKSGNCHRTTEDVVSCRACRFDRCLLAGMMLEAVQLPTNFDLESAKQRIKARKAEMQKEYYSNDNGTCLLLDRATINDEYAAILDQLYYTEVRYQRIRKSATELSTGPYFRKNLADLLANSGEPAPRPRMNPQILAQLLHGSLQPDYSLPHTKYLFLDLLMMVELFKTMPVCSQLDLEDKISLLSHVSMPAKILSAALYSLHVSSDTFLYPNGLKPVLMATYCFEQNQHIQQQYGPLRKRIFLDAFKSFRDISLSKEEFLLIRAIIFSHITTPKLSAAGHKLLLVEAEKYTKALLSICQHRLGEANGAKRFADVLLFVEFIFRTAQGHREYILFLRMLRAGAISSGPLMKSSNNQQLQFTSQSVDCLFVSECLRGCVELPLIQPL